MSRLAKQATAAIELDLADTLKTMGKQAKRAAEWLSSADSNRKNKILQSIARELDLNRSTIKAENKSDLIAGKENGLDNAMLDRLELTDRRIDAMIEGLGQVAGLVDPIGEISEMGYRPSGIQVGKMRVPLGVIGIIYESRPNVTIDAAALCLKSGNACILRGGKEAINSNLAIYQCIQDGLNREGADIHCVQVLQTTDRRAVGEMIQLDEYIDVIIPRGGKSLIERISKESRIPVIKHLDGICHVYIDDFAELNKAFDIALNAKTRRYGVCNAMETLLVSQAIASKILPRLVSAFVEKGVELRGCDKTRAIDSKNVLPANLEDWDTEYLAPILSIKIVENINEAIEHINRHGSQHTDAIVSQDYSRTREFVTRVDSSSVMVNASTAFADGFEYGLGAEIGISTDKLHARGPVGLVGLTSQKYVVFGDGHIRS